MQPTSYDHDFDAWAKRNAELMRQRKWSEIDAEQIAEEPAHTAKGQKRELVSRLAVLLAHLLKWQYQLDRRSDSWVSTIVTQRSEIQLLLDDSPSLKSDLDACVGKAYRFAKDRTARETGADKTGFPDSCPYSFDQIVSEDFWPM